MPEKPRNYNGTQVPVRLDDKTLYLLDLAARAKKMSRNAYISWALTESFTGLSLHTPSEPEFIYNGPDQPRTIVEPDAENERLLFEEKLVPKFWHEKPLTRLVLLRQFAPEYLSDEEREFDEYLYQRNDLTSEMPSGQFAGSRTLDRDRVNREWGDLWLQFQKQRGKGRKK